MAAIVPKYTVRKATGADIGPIKTLTNAEDWQIPLGFLQCVFDMDSKAWFVAESDTGEIIGVRVCIFFNANTAEGGLYVVRKDLTGKGIGRAVNRHCLTAVSDANITLSATVVSHGFTFYYDVHQRRGPVEVLLATIPEIGTTPGVTIVCYEEATFTELKAYDETICESEREYFFRNWIIMHAKYVLIARSRAGRVVGYGCLRTTEYCNEIAPLYADSDAIAWALLKELLQYLDPKEAVQMHIVAENKTMMKNIGQAPLTNVVTLHKMYTKVQVPQKLEQLYSLTVVGLCVV
ncbi:uncharacterized protein [Haliotis asinina]|uniref:uncharacterized protein n=1 Tax=Haliotis asinina TaxID=109174 RepID=UPI00353248DF